VVLVNKANEATLRDYTRSLKYQNRSQRTIDSYAETIEQLATATNDKPLEAAQKHDIEDYLTTYAKTHTPGGTAVRFRSLRAFYSWLEAEEIIERSPMAKMKQPYVPEVVVDVLTEAELTKLLKVTGGKDFEARRDHAIILVFIDCGLRVGELCGVKVDDVDLDTDVIYVVGKGRRPRSAPFGNKTGLALGRYLRERVKHPQSAIADFWIGARGIGLTESGVTQMLRRRCAQAGIPRIHPHQLRHSWAHMMKVNGISEDDLMRLGGWKSRTMVSRYGASAGDQRAREAHRQYSPGDRL
jgi:site-specific recombinase XerD